MDCTLRDLIDYGIPQKRGAFTDHQLRFLKEFYKSYPLWENKAPSSLPLSLIKDIFSGVAQLHSDEFIHRGLTPDAVFIISSKKTVFATIGALGSTLQPSKKTEKDYSADVFAVGCLVFFALLKGKDPYSDEHKRAPRGNRI